MLVSLPLVLRQHRLQGLVERGLRPREVVGQRPDLPAVLLRRIPVPSLECVADVPPHGGQGVPLRAGRVHEVGIQLGIAVHYAVGSGPARHRGSRESQRGENSEDRVT